MLRRTALVLAIVAALLVAAGAAPFAGGKVGNLGGDIGVGPTQLLADGTMEPDLVTPSGSVGVDSRPSFVRFPRIGPPGSSVKRGNPPLSEASNTKATPK